MADKDRASNPGTEPFVPDFEDTGTQGFVPDFEEDTGTQGFVPDFSDSDDTGSQPIPAAAEKPGESEDKVETETPAGASERDSGTEPLGASVQSVTVPGRYQYLKWWKLVLVLLGVWAGAAEVGLSLFYWWYHTIDKTPAVFMVLVYVVACTVGGRDAGDGPGQAADLGAVDRGDVGAVRLRRRRGAPVRLLLLRPHGSLSGRRHPILTH